MHGYKNHQNELIFIHNERHWPKLRQKLWKQILPERHNNTEIKSVQVKYIREQLIKAL